jgi:PHP family Zn ribbon phosphoesterase
MVETLIQGKYKKYKTCCPKCFSTLTYKVDDVKWNKIECGECGKKIRINRKNDYVIDKEYYW